MLGIPVSVRTMAPAGLFGGLPITYTTADFESGVIETEDSLGINVPATVAAIHRIYRDCEKILARELQFIQANGIEKIVADVPYLAGDIAEAAGIPCIGIGNFTWEWIYQPYLEYTAGAEALTEMIRTGYSNMTRFCRLPFHHEEGFEIFQRLDDVPLVVRQPKRTRDEVLHTLGFSETDSRPKILAGMRGRLAPGSLQIAATASPDMVFLYLDNQQTVEATNARRVQLGDQGVTYPDLLSASDIVISKYGYGIVSDCVAHRKPMLVPPRTGFREDEVFRREAPRYIPVAEITGADFQSGNWKDHLNALLSAKHQHNPMQTNGATVCAELIIKT
jgi:L-arabinokinase